jgi:beta-phosphoglucomutase-like phosphatase (HAD superfamily)
VPAAGRRHPPRRRHQHTHTPRTRRPRLGRPHRSRRHDGGSIGGHASKPAPDLVLLACEDLQIDPRLALVVGDSRFDAEAASAARAQFLGFRSPQSPSVQDLAGVTEFALVRPRH